MSTWVKFVPLGGLGRIGGNCAVYETEHDLIVVDCGMLMPTDREPGVNVILPDLRYVAERRDKLRAIVLTHAHEDHIGALPYALRQFDVPLYCTRFCQALIALKLKEHPDVDAEYVLLEDNVSVRIGDFVIEPIPVTHSIPEAEALAIKTSTGVIIHTGDFKLDPTPVDGRVTGTGTFKRYGDDGVLALLSDSTNTEQRGQSWSEQLVADTLLEVIKSASQRVLVTTFASNIHRLQAVVDASHAAGRTVVPVGRSVVQYVQTAIAGGYLKAPPGSLADVSYFDLLPRHAVTILASGSQGEPLSTMARIARSEYPYVRLEAGDRVILSSRRIPGNERAIGAMVNHLWRLGVEVIDDRWGPVHTSGHAFRQEQEAMLRWVRPQFFVPLHGEYRHLMQHAALAQECGVAPGHTRVVEDGEPVLWERRGDVVTWRREADVTAGYVYVDGAGVGDVDDTVLRDRRNLGEAGVVVCNVLLDEDDQSVKTLQLKTQGLIAADQEDVLHAPVMRVIQEALDENRDRKKQMERQEVVRRALRSYYKRTLQRRPVIIVSILNNTSLSLA